MQTSGAGSGCRTWSICSRPVRLSGRAAEQIRAAPALLRDSHTLGYAPVSAQERATPATGAGESTRFSGPARNGGIDPPMRGLAARPIVCVVVALCVAGLTLVVLMPGAQADAKPCSKPTNGQKVGWQRGHGPKHPAAKQRPCAPSGSPAPRAEVSSVGDGVASLSDQDEVAGPTLIPVPLEQTAPTERVERSSSRATMPEGPTSTPSSTPTTEIQVTAQSPAAIDDSVLLVGVVIGFILAVSAVVVAAGRRGGRRAN
jgi:hypothetical protein